MLPGIDTAYRGSLRLFCPELLWLCRLHVPVLPRPLCTGIGMLTAWLWLYEPELCALALLPDLIGVGFVAACFRAACAGGGFTGVSSDEELRQNMPHPWMPRTSTRRSSRISHNLGHQSRPG